MLIWESEPKVITKGKNIVVINRIPSLCASASHAERGRMDSAAITLWLQCQNYQTAHGAWD